ncbi:MAG: hypothetical protein CR972_01960 [Candidatus Moraniibacteriota bacterium]|nr:MAG: hypothetical protein CR972_01960 [Candidatus Moranbacteria bacterium]
MSLQYSKCFLVRMRYSATKRDELLCADQFFNQYITADGFHDVWHIARRILADKIAKKFHVPISAVHIKQLSDMRVWKHSEHKCIESQKRALKNQKKVNGPKQMRLPFTGV